MISQTLIWNIKKEINYDSEYINWNSVEYLKSGNGNYKSFARRVSDFS